MYNTKIKHNTYIKLSDNPNRSYYNTKENFGSFSLFAAVRQPYNPARYDASYQTPKVAGVT